MARRRSSTSIAATPPIFPAYLLSSFNFVLHHRKSIAPTSPTASSTSSSSSSPTSSPASSSASSPATIPSGSRRHSTLSRRLSRVAPDTLRCRSCSTDLAFTAQIISKGFTGRYGHAYLVAPGPAQSSATEDAQPSLLNIRVGRSEDRQLVTGWHTVADIFCATCACNLGWKYVDAQEPSQMYKVGKYILEMERVVKHRSWDDVAVRDLDLFEREKGEEEKGKEKEKEVEARGHDESDDGDSDEIVFDSSDEEECEDIFLGTWNAATVAKRRSQAVARSISLVL
ncbi:hypothetical protein E4U32_004168 [Claviceps aff. humidiphila group G2b]|nr:hypothetical protein E4U32_004168 [Claviceps aff. humidiphila group G2b]